MTIVYEGAAATPSQPQTTSFGPTVSTVIRRVQVELDDPQGERFDSAYIMGFMDQCYEDLCGELAAYDLTFDDKEVELDVTATTSDLSAFQATGQALQYMIQPVSLEWKLSGEDDTRYRPAPKVDKVRDVASDQEGIANYEFRDGIIYIAPSSVDVTVRVRFQSAPSALDEETDTIISGTTNLFVYKVAKKIASRNSGADKILAALQEEEHAARENFETTMVKGEQSKVRRLGRASRRNGVNGWRSPWF